MNTPAPNPENTVTHSYWEGNKSKRITVQFDSAEHLNALRYEYCAHKQYITPAMTRFLVAICDNEEQAIKLAKYHYYSSGSNFKIYQSNKA